MMWLAVLDAGALGRPNIARKLIERKQISKNSPFSPRVGLGLRRSDKSFVVFYETFIALYTYKKNYAHFAYWWIAYIRCYCGLMNWNFICQGTRVGEALEFRTGLVALLHTRGGISGSKCVLDLSPLLSNRA